MSQVPEESFTYAQYRNAFKKRFEFERPTIILSNSTGTHFWWDDTRGERHFGVISDLPAPDHRHIHSALLRQLNQAALGVTDLATVNTITFTPETAPYHVWAHWTFAYAGTDNDLDGTITQSFSFSGVTNTSFQDIYVQGAGGLQRLTLVGHARYTTTVARTILTRTAEITNGAPRDTVDVAGSDLFLLVVYEKRINV